MTLTINKRNSRIFVAIAKQDTHSFLMFGIYKDNQVDGLLSRVGKVHYSRDTACSFITNALFTSVPAGLKNEPIFRSDRGPTTKPISYQAYDISYRTYLEWIQFLEKMQTESKSFACYKPSRVTADEIEMVYTDELLIPAASNAATPNESCQQLSIGNTCRHTALELLESVRGVPNASISSQYNVDLPYQTVLEDRKPSDKIPFYVLPLPPTLFHTLPAVQRTLIEKLYHRMECIPSIAHNNPATIKKFQALKELYEQLAYESESSLELTLESIKHWKESNKDHLQGLRVTYFFDQWMTRQSATSRLINEIEQELEFKK